MDSQLCMTGEEGGEISPVSDERNTKKRGSWETLDRKWASASTRFQSRCKRAIDRFISINRTIGVDEVWSINTLVAKST